MHQKIVWFIFVLLVIKLLACKKDNIDQTNYNKMDLYIPYKLGSYLVYKVDSVNYDDFRDTVIYSSNFRKEVIEEIDNTIVGRKLYRVLVYVAADSN